MNPVQNSSDTVTKEIFIECSQETLFPFFSDPDKLVRWMGRNVLLAPDIGGKFRIDINGSATLIHHGLPAQENETHLHGWTHYMARLQMLAQGQDPGVDPWSEQAME